MPQEKVVGWLLEAVEKDTTLGQKNPGVCDEGRCGVTKDPMKAAGCLRKAAELGLAESQYALGMLYMAAQQGDTFAIDQLRMMGFT